MDRVTVGVTRYVMSIMSEKYVQPPVLDYSNIFRQSTALTPIIFVLSPGADPAFDVFKLGEEMGYKPGTKLKYMALGQGMGPKAQEFIETGSTRGLWIMLQNCHLLPRFGSRGSCILMNTTSSLLILLGWPGTSPGG